MRRTLTLGLVLGLLLTSSAQAATQGDVQTYLLSEGIMLAELNQVASPPQKPTPAVASVSMANPLSLRSYSLIPAMAGGSLVVAGGISWAISRGELHRLRTASPSLKNEADVRRSVSDGRSTQLVGLSLLGVGTAALLTAAGLYLFGGPDQPMALGMGTNGSTAFVYGRWP